MGLTRDDIREIVTEIVQAESNKLGKLIAENGEAIRDLKSEVKGLGVSLNDARTLNRPGSL